MQNYLVILRMQNYLVILRMQNYLVILYMQNYLVCKILPLFARTTDFRFDGVPEDNTLPDVEPVCRTNKNDECVCDWDSYVSTCGIPGNSYMSFSGAGCSKLTMSLVNVSLKFGA